MLAYFKSGLNWHKKVSTHSYLYEEISSFLRDFVDDVYLSQTKEKVKEEVIEVEEKQVDLIPVETEVQ